MKLLAALDLSYSTPAVLREARVWTRRLSAELLLLHVADPDPDFIGYGAGPESSRLAVAHKFQRAQKQIEALAVELRKDGLDTTALLLQEVDVADTILREADRLHVDAIVIGTHARGTAHVMFIGSISKSVILKATRTVILVSPHDTP